MADIFDELLGPNGAPPAELIAALRRQRTLGQVGALSGDKSVARLGGGLYDDSVKQAQDLRDRRDRTTARNEEMAYRNSQAAALEGERKADREYRDRALKQARELAEAQNRNALEIAGLRGSAGGIAAKKARDQQLNKLEAAFRTSGLGNVWSAVSGAKEVVDEYTERDPQGNVVGYKGVPGVGGLANQRALGIGTATQLFSDPKGKENQSKIAALQNLVLQARSGAAVTDPELQRMLAETGLTQWSSDEDFLRAFPRLMQKAEESVRNTLAGYDPDVVSEYLGRGALKGFKGAPRSKEAELEAFLYGEGQ